MLALGRQRKQRTHVNRKRRMPCINLCASDVPASSNRGSFVGIHHSHHIYLCIARRCKSRRASKPIMCLLDSVVCVDSGHWHARRSQKASVATYAHPCRRYAAAGMQAWNSIWVWCTMSWYDVIFVTCSTSGDLCVFERVSRFLKHSSVLTFNGCANCLFTLTSLAFFAPHDIPAK